MEDFNREFTPGNLKKAMADAGASSGDLWKVHPSQLRIDPEYNVRTRNQEYAERVRWIADSIKLNGFYMDKPISGFIAKEGDLDVIIVTGGHRRHEAVLLAINEGAEVEVVPVIPKPRGTTMEDLLVDLVVGNDGDKVDTYGQAIVCKRLVAFGWDTKKIAMRLGFKSTTHVDNLLTLAGAPLAVRNMVIEGKVAASTAIDALNAHGEKAVAKLQKAIDKANGKKATPKHMVSEHVKVIKKKAPDLFKALNTVHVDPGYHSLSDETKEALTALLAEIPQEAQ